MKTFQYFKIRSNRRILQTSFRCLIKCALKTRGGEPEEKIMAPAPSLFELMTPAPAPSFFELMAPAPLNNF